MEDWVEFPIESSGPGHDWVQSLTDFEPEPYFDPDEDPTPRIGRFRVKSFITTYSSMAFLGDIHSLNFGEIGKFFFYFSNPSSARNPDSNLTPFEFLHFILNNRISMDNFDSMLSNWRAVSTQQDLNTTAVIWSCSNCGLRSLSNTEPDKKTPTKTHVFNVGGGTFFCPPEEVDQSCEERQLRGILSV